MDKRTRLLYIIILSQGLIALIGSLFFSNYLGYAPCDLCWYQRICMYPLIVVSLVALLKNDKNAIWYGLPLSLIGLAVSIWHNTIYFLANNADKDLGIPCSVNGVSCTTKYFELGGFISIPQLSLVAFILTTICFLLLVPKTKG